MDKESGRTTGINTSSETGNISQQHWNTPFSQVKQNNFDEYLLVGKKGGETVVYGSKDFKETSNFIENLGYLRPEKASEGYGG